MTRPTSAPSLYAPILAQSRFRPHATAVVGDTGPISYRSLCLHIDRVTRTLATHSLRPGSRVVVDMANGYFARLALIALSRMGVIGAATNQHAVVRPDAVLTDRPLAAPGLRVIQASLDWTTKSADSLPPFVEQPHDWDDPMSIVLSSGTTGQPKLALFSYDSLFERSRSTCIAYGLVPTTRFLTLMGLSTITGLVLPFSCWSVGATVLLPAIPEGTSMVAVLRYNPNVLFLSTAQLEAFTRSMTPEWMTTQPPVVFVAGSALSPQVSRDARLRLSSSLVMVYGSTEVGTVTLAPAAHADAQPGLTGYVQPPSQVEIVDEDGRTQPAGTTGEVRIRTVGQADRYLDDNAASANAFRNGWFHPGDLGVLGANGELKIVGRVTEVMNFGGVKVSPQVIEEGLAGLPGVAEFAAFAVRTPAGDMPFLAVVPAADGYTPEIVIERCRQAFPKMPPITVVQVRRLPRNEMGKVLRAELAAQVTASAQRPPTLH